MHSIDCDPKKNRIHIKLAGLMALDEMVKCSNETIAATARLKRGYDVITDIVDFSPAGPEVTKQIERVQAHFVASGARKGVRIVGQKVIASLQFKRTGSNVGYSSVNVATLADAEIELSK
jgi:hypothetical protein